MQPFQQEQRDQGWTRSAFSLVPTKLFTVRFCFSTLNNSPTSAHQHRPAEITIYCRFHPLRTESLPVVRVYELHDESYYVVWRPIHERGQSFRFRQ
jgi:hypothetical protein